MMLNVMTGLVAVFVSLALFFIAGRVKSELIGMKMMCGLLGLGLLGYGMWSVAKSTVIEVPKGRVAVAYSMDSTDHLEVRHYTAGLHLLVPPADSVRYVEVVIYTMTDTAMVRTTDARQVRIAYSVTWRLNPVASLGPNSHILGDEAVLRERFLRPMSTAGMTGAAMLIPPSSITDRDGQREMASGVMAYLRGGAESLGTICVVDTVIIHDVQLAPERPSRKTKKA